MKVKVILRYTDAILGAEKIPGDIFDVTDSRGAALIRAGCAEEVTAKQTKRSRPAKSNEDGIITE